jgi:chemotaxis methyl-accepting protein methylase
VGCGPSLEVFQASIEKNISQKSFHLFDQDKNALNSSSQRLSQKNINFSLYEGNIIKSIFKMDKNKFDLIYSTGMFDYFDIPSSKKLIKTLWSKLTSNGCLIVTNAHPNNPTKLWCEYAADWYLLYKNESQMNSLSEGLEDLNHTSLDIDSQGVYQYLCLYKK